MSVFVGVKNVNQSRSSIFLWPFRFGRYLRNSVRRYREGLRRQRCAEGLPKNPPYSLTLASGEPLRVERILREVPGDSVVALARHQGRCVLAKLFLNPRRAARHAAADVRSARRLRHTRVHTLHCLGAQRVLHRPACAVLYTRADPNVASQFPSLARPGRPRCKRMDERSLYSGRTLTRRWVGYASYMSILSGFLRYPDEMLQAGSWLTCNGKSQVVKLMLGNTTYVVKRYTPHSWRRILKDALRRRSLAARAWHNMHRFRRHGLLTAAPVLFLEKRAGPLICKPKVEISAFSAK